LEGDNTAKDDQIKELKKLGDALDGSLFQGPALAQLTAYLQAVKSPEDVMNVDNLKMLAGKDIEVYTVQPTTYYFAGSSGGKQKSWKNTEGKRLIFLNDDEALGKKLNDGLKPGFLR
jgi:hypothetical protein